MCETEKKALPATGRHIDSTSLRLVSYSPNRPKGLYETVL